LVAGLDSYVQQAGSQAAAEAELAANMAALSARLADRPSSASVIAAAAAAVAAAAAGAGTGGAAAVSAPGSPVCSSLGAEPPAAACGAAAVPAAPSGGQSAGVGPPAHRISSPFAAYASTPLGDSGGGSEEEDEAEDMDCMSDLELPEQAVAAGALAALGGTSFAPKRSPLGKQAQQGTTPGDDGCYHAAPSSAAKRQRRQAGGGGGGGASVAFLGYGAFEQPGAGGLDGWMAALPDARASADVAEPAAAGRQCNA
jgi:hypothetical protein